MSMVFGGGAAGLEGSEDPSGSGDGTGGVAGGPEGDVDGAHPSVSAAPADESRKERRSIGGVATTVRRCEDETW